MSKVLADDSGQALDTLLAKTPSLWKGGRSSRSQTTVATGYARLDRQLPGGGWPRGAVTELMAASPGVGELSLLFPALATIGQQGRWLVLVDPPWVPYPAALHGHGLSLERLLLIRTRAQKESLWACEQALQDLPGGAVLCWPESIRFAGLRRIQLAAQEKGGMVFMFRPAACAAESSPAALRLELDSMPGAMRIEVLKCRGPRPTTPVLIQQPRYGKRMVYERSPVAGDTVAPPGAGLSHPGPRRGSRPGRYH